VREASNSLKGGARFSRSASHRDSQVLSEPEEMIEQMQICESHGAAGWSIFRLFADAAVHRPAQERGAVAKRLFPPVHKSRCRELLPSQTMDGACDTPAVCFLQK
jgi:hypothetical protein